MLKSTFGAEWNPEGSGRPGDTAVLPQALPTPLFYFPTSPPSIEVLLYLLPLP